MQTFLFLGCFNSPFTKGEQPSLFAVPKDENLRKQWERNLHRKDKALDETCSVCELHFELSCITRNFAHIINGEEVRIPRGKLELLPNAVPTLLPNVPSYLSKKRPLPRGKEKAKVFVPLKRNYLQVAIPSRTRK